MGDYQLTWITEQLAAGHAPHSYQDLEDIKSYGISSIVNLCSEFQDLHEIQQTSGFTVCFLPTLDECAPDMEKMDSALQWVEKQIAKGRKVLVHCRFGVGRTGTFVAAFLMRTGMSLKSVEKRLKKTRANPSNYCQWKLLRKYDIALKTKLARKHV